MITRTARGEYLIAHEGRNHIVYVAGPANDRWVFHDGEVYRGDFRVAEQDATRPPAASLQRMAIVAPMPSRVSRVLVQAGAIVKQGDTLLILEAMKMELPLRAPGDAAVTAVHCGEGDLVQADALLVELGPP
jgi:biotin carboxyl carrier protein